MNEPDDFYGEGDWPILTSRDAERATDEAHERLRTSGPKRERLYWWTDERGNAFGPFDAGELADMCLRPTDDSVQELTHAEYITQEYIGP